MSSQNVNKNARVYKQNVYSKMLTSLQAMETLLQQRLADGHFALFLR